jgi:hypothetical protein
MLVPTLEIEESSEERSVRGEVELELVEMEELELFPLEVGLRPPAGIFSTFIPLATFG